MVQTLSTLSLPLDSYYLVIETDGCESGWGGALFRKLSKYDPKTSESLCRYASEKYKEKGHLTPLDYELLAVIYCLEAFVLFICSKAEITIRTDCETIIKYNQQSKGIKKRLSPKRWIKFADIILNKGLKVNWNISKV